MVAGIETIECTILCIVGNQSRVLIVTGEVIVGQATDEEGLSLDVLHLRTERTAVTTGVRQDKVADIDSVVPVTP